MKEIKSFLCDACRCVMSLLVHKCSNTYVCTTVFVSQENL